MSSDTNYSIQQISNLTGLSKQVIRKWEERYKIIKPNRLQNGYRVYTESDLSTLRQIISYTKNGYSVIQACDKILQDKEINHFHSVPSEINYLELLIEAGQKADDSSISRILSQAHNILGIEKLLDEIIVPFLIEIGELWCSKNWAEHQEAVSSQTIRDYLVSIRRSIYVEEDAPIVVGSCLPFERHENAIQILLIKCMLKGYRTIMLGPAPAPSAIENIVDMVSPVIVLLSGSTDIVFSDGGEAIQTLDNFAQSKPSTKFYAGGHGVKGRLSSLKAIKEVHHFEEIFIE